MELTTIIEQYRSNFDNHYGSRTTHQMNKAISWLATRNGTVKWYCIVHPARIINPTFMPVGIAAVYAARTMTQRRGWHDKRRNYCRLSISW